ncbi:molybdenum cofactor biosynthesis protein B [Gilvimarinus agarilyticus]|uniref:molybdenum cofactor biosynthesis protein B n=1 Tax=Gilvimarinus sp. 2_MG-2023 TaxID=3062666 RepID=UPI001C0A07DB|nr:molybdenum cofactor biosynthesis protein B [Gilvimarinus sp. 2_MG-2023]MBU2884544.1 molybdenum cofactor biosynthesis protein B [Gilvimarinus agarilyticus]MDO6569672.1 molybdenum cofactor biosynthesis protein B [Gilvimarinus sp. 2_MG-2023]
MSREKVFVPLNIAVLTVSDTRNRDTDTSGQALQELAESAGHKVLDRAIVKDDIYQIRALVSNWIAGDDIQVVLITGGTGFAGRDSTVEAVTPLFDKTVVGFGELFRQVSYREIGSSTIQSRATAGLANRTLMFCLPGSTGACKTAWTIIQEQLDSRHGPCNFVGQL